MQVEQLNSAQGLSIDGPLLITPRAFGDDRGWFFESWNQNNFNEASGETVLFSQDNHSRSVRGVLRGMHYQLAPEPQAKLVRASVGEIFDVAVDIRRSSPQLWPVGGRRSQRRKQTATVGARGVRPWLPHPQRRRRSAIQGAGLLEQGLRTGHSLE